mmetsp:Transcript_57795/g.135118  ORF Transcript_57795/g.135118 Transcript_57795/m.135118 type:complete len:135 (+) Transcript_57795:26-430(+)
MGETQSAPESTDALAAEVAEQDVKSSGASARQEYANPSEDEWSGELGPDLRHRRQSNNPLPQTNIERMNNEELQRGIDVLSKAHTDLENEHLLLLNEMQILRDRHAHLKELLDLVHRLYATDGHRWQSLPKGTR